MTKAFLSQYRSSSYGDDKMATRRDNFSEKTRTQIARLVGGLCAYPGCRAATFGATADGMGVLDIGIAAHICAAAPGGPRYDEQMSSTERSSAANGVWMCADHGRAIDVDPKFYTVEKLRAWKREAEHEAFLRVTRHPTAVTIPPDLGEIYRAVRADLDVLRKMARWPSSSIALTLKVDGFDEPMTTSGLAAAVQQIEDLILTAPPGTGKTTTLLQIAESVLHEGNGAPIFVSLGDWASDARGILDSVLARSTFAAVSEAEFRAAAAHGNVVLLLDGWNELDTTARKRARIELERLKAEIPRLAYVISTRRQALDVPLTGKRVDLLALSETQQLAIAQALGGDAGAAMLDRAWRTPGVRDLVEIPLYLTVLLSLGDAPFPETKEELLRRFVAAHEAEARRAEVLVRDAKGQQETFLTDLAIFATRTANTAVSDTDARRTLSSAMTVLIEDGQISGRADPGELLATLIDNTVLVRSGEGAGVAFQHQQFQEWFASHEVEKRMREAPSSAAATRLLQETIFDSVAWEEPILFAIERMSRGGPNDQRASGAAILAAFDVDPMLAAEMIYRAADEVWAEVEKPIFVLLDRWHVPGQPDRALRFMMLSARPEFLDRVWPLISNVNEQISLRALRIANGLRPSILGADAAKRLRALPAPTRLVMLSELAMDGGPEALDLATEVAESDSDPDVQNQVIDALSFRYADRHLVRILKNAPEAVFEHAVGRGVPLSLGDDPVVFEGLAAAQVRLVDQESPLDELREIAFGRRLNTDEKVLRDLVGSVEIKDRQDPSTSLVYQAHLLYPRAVAEGLVDRIRLGKPVFYGAGDLIAQIEPGLEDQALLEFVLGDAERSDRAEAAASALGPNAAGTIIDAIVDLNIVVSDRSKPYDKAASDRLHTLQSRLERVPGRILVQAVQQRSCTADIPALSQYARLLSRHPQKDDDRSRPFDDETQEAVRVLAEDWGERLLAARASRSNIATIATLIAHVPHARLLDLLRRMLDDNLARLAEFRATAEATKWQRSEAVTEAQSPLTEHYFRAFRAIDVAATTELMLEYLGAPVFGEQAARVLSEQWIARHRPPPERRFGGGVDFSQVRQRRAERAANPDATTDEADAILAAAGRLTGGGTVDTLHRALMLATIAASIPHGGHDNAYRLLVDQAPLEVRARLLTAMVLSGDAIEMEVVEQGIVATFEAAQKEPWILIDSDAWRLRDWLQLLPFATDLSRLKTIVAAIPEEHRRDGRLEFVINGLAVTPSQGAEDALFGLAELQPSLLENHAWSSAALRLHTATGVERLIELIASGTRVGGRGSRSWGWPHQLGDRLAEFPCVRRQLFDRLKGSEQTKGNRILALALADKPDIDALELLIDLERAWATRLIDMRTLQAVVTDQLPAPEWSNAYSIVPKAVPEMRRRLLHCTTDGSSQDRASVVLTWIDHMRDEYGRALEEPRHPDFASGKPWPIMVGNLESAVN